MISSFAGPADLALTLLANCSELFLLHAADCADGGLLCEDEGWNLTIRDWKEQSTFCKKLRMRSAAARAKIVVRTGGDGRCVGASFLDRNRALVHINAVTP